MAPFPFGRFWTKVRLLVVVLGAMAGLWALQGAIWSGSSYPWDWLLWQGIPSPNRVSEWTIQIAMGAWVLPMLPMLSGLVGMLAHPRRDKAVLANPLPNVVSFRIVSRGQNAAVLHETVRNIERVMEDLPVFNWAVEVVTDQPVLWPASAWVHFIRVPEGYRTPKRTRFKARALQYALQYSPLPADGWIVHMDEETQLTYSAVLGIRNAIEEEEASGRLRIGQGAILYHRRLSAGVMGLFLSLADMIRTGDDLGRFHFQHRVGLPLFGLHGSYILTRNDVEADVGFDFGPPGSVTEDAFWALAQMARGRRCRWVEGYMVEQPPTSIRDFLRQRRRWLWGLLLVLRYAPAPLWGKIGLGVCVAGWASSWLGLAAFWADLGIGQVAPWQVRAAGDISLVCFYTWYLAGLAENLRYVHVVRWRRALLYVLQIMLVPAFTVLEAAAVIYGLVTRGGGFGFHVIAKPAQEKPLPRTQADMR